MDITVSQRYISYLLILLAVSSFVFIIVRLLQSFSLEFTDKRFHDAKHKTMKNSIGYFINKAKLFQIQISTGILIDGIFLAILLVCGVTNIYIILPLAIAVFCIGFIIPYFYYARKVKKRAEEFNASILDFSMALTSGLRSGQALPQAVELFTRRTSGVLKDELMIVIREYRLGVDLAEALQHMYDRLPGEDLQLLIISIKLTNQSGGSLSEVLQKITQTIRSRTEFNQKLMGLTAQGRFEALAMSLAPLAAFLLLFCVNNELMLPLVQTGIGWCAIGIMLTLETIGYIIIRMIVDIKV